jgi:hypothetical protein
VASGIAATEEASYQDDNVQKKKTLYLKHLLDSAHASSLVDGALA